MSTILVKSKNTTTIRFDEYTLQVIDKAAQLLNQTRTSFLQNVAREKAEEVIRERTKTMEEIGYLLLSPQGSQQIMEALSNPPEPTEKMRQALQEFNQRTDIIDRS